MRMGNIIIAPWNKRNFIYRVFAILLIIAWLAWGITIFMEAGRINDLIKQKEEEQLRKEELLRREAAYRHATLEQQAVKSGVRNAVDTFRQ